MAAVMLGKHPVECDLIAFDKDGTLIDFHYFWAARVTAGVEAITRRLEAEGSSPDHQLPEQVYRSIGFEAQTGRFLGNGLLATSTNEEVAPAVAAVLNQHGLSLRAATRIVREDFIPVLVAPPEAKFLRTFGELPTLFDALRQAGVRVAVITNDDRAITEGTLSLLRVSDRIDALICADDPIPSKPAPEPILNLSARFSVRPERMVMVGDTYFDLLMAQRAGVGTRVGVLSGAGLQQDLAPYADLLLSSVAEIRLA